MKKVFYLFAAAITVSFVACSKQENTSTEELDNGRFIIKASVDESTTKGVYDSDGAFTWKAGDLIGIHAWDEGGDWPQQMGLIDGDGETEATFETTINKDCGTVVFYPYNGGKSNPTNAATDGTNYSYGDDKLYVHLFPTTNYTNASGHPQNLIPVASKIEDKAAQAKRQESNIQFKQIASGVKVTVTDIPVAADKVSLTIPDKNITGWFYIDPDDIGTSGIVYGSNGTDTAYITFDPDAGTTTERTFVFPVPPTAIPGITLKMYAFNQEVWSRTAPEQPSVSVGQVLKLKDVAVSKIPVKVGIVEHFADRTGYKVRIIGGSSNGTDVDLVSLGTEQNKNVGYWGSAQKFYMFYAVLPSDATEYKIHKGDSWFGNNGSVSYPYAFIFNYDGDKASYYNAE